MMYFGVDVSKNKLDLCWLRDAANDKLKTKVFANTKEGCQSLSRWVREQAKVDHEDCVFTMEATGVYHERLAYHLHDAGAEVRLVQPQQFHHFVASYGVRSKTDKRDSCLLARYGDSGHGRVWQPEPAPIRQLKALLGRVEAVEQDLQRELNRQESAEISGVSQAVMTSIETVIATLREQKAQLERDIHNHIDRHPDLKDDEALLQSIPGIGGVVSRYMVSVLRSRDFTSARECAAYLGMVPVYKQSGKSVLERPRLSKAGNSQIRTKLYMAAIVAIRYNPDACSQYERLLKRGKAKMSALGAVMRKLIHICFGVLKHQKEYVPQTA